MKNIDWPTVAKQTTFCVRNFIDGEYSECLGENYIDKYSPRDGSLLYRFAEGTGSEVGEAATSARNAFNDGRWSDLSVHQRKAVLNKLADLIEAHREEFALNESLDVGKPIKTAFYGDTASAAGRLRAAAENADKLLSFCGADDGLFAYQQRKPVGVVGAIIGWNYPLSMAAGRIAPALIMGNTVVLKPSEFTSLSASRLAELAIEAGIPAGVLNVVHGSGSIVGDALARHPHIDLLTFVGSSATGKQMMVSAGQSNMKRLILECGGKSPYIVFDDCPEDLDFIAEEIIDAAFTNQGALCVAGTRLLLQEGIKDKLLPKVIEQAAKLIPQDPLNTDCQFGALINEAHLQKVLGYIKRGTQQGGNLVLGGKPLHIDSGGYYIGPTVFDQVEQHHSIAQEEIFGPVLSVLTFKDEAEAIQIANDSCYGLAAYAATQNLGRAQRLSQKLNAGLFILMGTSEPSNGSVSLSLEAHKESGFGVEGGVEGLKAYSVCTAVNLYI